MNLLGNKRGKLIEELAEARRADEDFHKTPIDEAVKAMLTPRKGAWNYMDVIEAEKELRQVHAEVRSQATVLSNQIERIEGELRASAPATIQRFQDELNARVNRVVNTYRPKKAWSEDVKTPFGMEPRTGETLDRDNLNATLSRLREIGGKADLLKITVVDGKEADRGLGLLWDALQVIEREIATTPVFEPLVTSL